VYFILFYLFITWFKHTLSHSPVGEESQVCESHVSSQEDMTIQSRFEPLIKCTSVVTVKSEITV